jgi:hypothetical protein
MICLTVKPTPIAIMLETTKPSNDVVATLFNRTIISAPTVADGQRFRLEIFTATKLRQQARVEIRVGERPYLIHPLDRTDTARSSLPTKG